MDLKAKIGPLPAYVWGGLIGLVLVGYLYMRSSKAKVAGATPVSPAGSNPLDGAFTPGTTSGGGGALSNPSGSLINNAVWLTQGVAYLTGKGNSPLAAQQALSRYLNGDTLSSTDSALVNVWVAKQGTPPEGNPTPTGSTSTGTQNSQNAAYTSFTRDSNSGRIFGTKADGSMTWLDAATYKALGFPAWIEGVANNPAMYSSYTRDPVTGSIFGVTVNGPVWLSPAAYKALGSPATSSIKVPNATPPPPGGQLLPGGDSLPVA